MALLLSRHAATSPTLRRLVQISPMYLGNNRAFPFSPLPWASAPERCQLWGELRRELLWTSKQPRSSLWHHFYSLCGEILDPQQPCKKHLSSLQPCRETAAFSVACCALESHQEICLMGKKCKNKLRKAKGMTIKGKSKLRGSM